MGVAAMGKKLGEENFCKAPRRTERRFMDWNPTLRLVIARSAAKPGLLAGLLRFASNNRLMIQSFPVKLSRHAQARNRPLPSRQRLRPRPPWRLELLRDVRPESDPAGRYP